MAEPLLRVRDLRITFSSPTGPVEAVRGVSFDVGREKLGIVGESGSGKTMTGRALLKLSPRSATVQARRLDFAGIDLAAASERRMRSIRGARISMIMQDPKYSLNPLMRVGAQIAEACRLHQKVGAREAAARSLAMLEAVHIREPKRVFDLYPHEVSGGMGQRIMIAMMLVTGPDLIVADEPTSALDVTVRRQVLSILDELVTRRGAGLIFISHDLNLVAEFCDRVLVMYAGRIVEELHARDLHAARHPYTQALLRSLPRLEAPVAELAVPTRDPEWRDGPTYRLGELA
ncbi:ABC transporter ATP-binding protein [Teichococcus vastitatis]|jgi:peptide/nickel transport system ATP-binding protein|uniref:ABC transporter ATP-binding protein n=1 Tax=Teichococcus vastitatis TaxID=2307076 RepID=A0ABS9WAN6_9PROT|nr:ABC transporter ATP-binding protein [Pseudoroseomonas vastitatis]MCI0756053.1 ABC transporter ATP-binding protein [Pseudoroseomonas vastitatis]